MTSPRLVINTEITPGLDRVKGRWIKADKDYTRRNWALMGYWARRAKALTQAAAPVGKTGKFKKGIWAKRYRRSKTIVGFNITVPQPIGTFILKGTKAHKIRAKNASALAFFWDKIGMHVLVPRRGGFKTHVRSDTLWIGKGYVDHPGTKANPFVQRAKRRWWPQMAKELKQSARGYSSDLVDL